MRWCRETRDRGAANTVQEGEQDRRKDLEERLIIGDGTKVGLFSKGP